MSFPDPERDAGLPSSQGRKAFLDIRYTLKCSAGQGLPVTGQNCTGKDEHTGKATAFEFA